MSSGEPTVVRGNQPLMVISHRPHHGGVAEVVGVARPGPQAAVHHRT